ncbi:unnamed protein product [Allacma fusca]|uniref:Uncharacterized protein n=1 Tax=Allacma fusca TaxID=39272 RepID=A0A8J2PP91_9HEXA|nr:unnamed protein product [Allacma fusca]
MCHSGQWKSSKEISEVKGRRSEKRTVLQPKITIYHPFMIKIQAEIYCIYLFPFFSFIHNEIRSGMYRPAPIPPQKSSIDSIENSEGQIPKLYCEHELSEQKLIYLILDMAGLPDEPMRQVSETEGE